MMIAVDVDGWTDGQRERRRGGKRRSPASRLFWAEASVLDVCLIGQDPLSHVG